MSMHTMRMGLLLAAACLGGCAGPAGESAPGPDRATRPPSTPADANDGLDGNAPAPTGLEARLARLLIERPEDPVIAPRRDVSRPQRELPADVRPGVLVIGRAASLQREANSPWPALVFRNPAGLPHLSPRRVLPNALRERMEIARRGRPGECVFEVSGETTVFRGEAYLLLTRATPKASDEQSSTGPADGNAPHVADADGNASDAGAIMRELLRDRPARSTQLPDLAPDANDASAAPRVVASHGDDRSRVAVVDRIVYIEPADPHRPEGWWLARMIGDNTLGEPPLRLLPCQLLERAMALSARPSPTRQRFRVSGPVTVYRGREYLLLRKLFIERDVRQF